MGGFHSFYPSPFVVKRPLHRNLNLTVQEVDLLETLSLHKMKRKIQNLTFQNLVYHRELSKFAYDFSCSVLEAPSSCDFAAFYRRLIPSRTVRSVAAGPAQALCRADGHGNRIHGGRDLESLASIRIRFRYPLLSSDNQQEILRLHNDGPSFRDASSDDDQRSANDGLSDNEKEEDIYELRRRNGRPFFRRRWWLLFLLGHTVLFLIYIGILVAVYKYAKKLGAIRGPNLVFSENIWIEPEVMRHYGREDLGVALPEGGGYIGTLNVYHELHCIWSNTSRIPIANATTHECVN
ncbi:hypothetical protein VTN00DRAFT_1083 [Thermoascus crustaceus]|uniref:uncharacterized protein n=1 Tax=Thermoascus crustaceus TaxID=5088 RepID=UPI0037424EEE